LSRKRNYATPRLVVEGCDVDLKRSVRYLGPILDSHLTFTKHLKVISGKAMDTARALGQLMPKVSGPSQKKKTLLMSVVYSKLLYVALTWACIATKY